MHIHPALPWIGAAWRRKVQGFVLPSLDGPERRVSAHPPRIGEGPAPKPLVFGAAFYQTYLTSRTRARRNLFAALADFRRKLPPGRLILSAADLATAREEPEAYFLAVESLRYLRDPADVRALWDLGVRSLQPIHFLETAMGGSSREGFLPASRGGLTTLGREMLAEMTSLGMILDLAHMNRRTADECLSAYPGPVLCSHTGLYEVRASARNLPGDQAREIFRRGGLVGVTCWRHLLGRETGPLRAAWTRAYCATVHALAYLHPSGKSLVAVGSDRGAPIRAPAWIFSSAHRVELSARLAELGWEAAAIRGFLAENVHAFLERSLPAA